MKLCFIADPNSFHTYRWLTYFAERGHIVHLIAEHQVKKSLPGITVTDLTKIINIRKIRYLIWALIVRQLVRRLQPDILHAHQVSSAGWLGLATGFHPFVVTAWGSDVYLQPRKSHSMRRLAQRVLTTADLVTADSADLLTQTQKLGADPNKTRLSQWGVDLTTFTPARDQVMVRNRLDLPDQPIILSPRAMRSIYMHHITIQAIASVRNVITDAIFVFRDYNPDPPDYTDQLKRQAQELGVAEAVHFIGEITRYEDVVDLYRAANLVVSVPLSDGTPVSVLEAFACGVPVIASNLPSLREWITDGENGLFVPTGEVSALAKAIIRLLKNQTLYTQIRDRALETVRERADHATWMAQVESMYQELAR